MRIRYTAPDPRAGTLAEVDDRRATQLIDAGRAQKARQGSEASAPAATPTPAPAAPPAAPAAPGRGPRVDADESSNPLDDRDDDEGEEVPPRKSTGPGSNKGDTRTRENKAATTRSVPLKKAAAKKTARKR